MYALKLLDTNSFPFSYFSISSISFTSMMVPRKILLGRNYCGWDRITSFSHKALRSLVILLIWATHIHHLDPKIRCSCQTDVLRGIMRKSVWIFHGNPDTCYHIILWVNVQGVISKCTATLQVKDPFIEKQFIFDIATHHFSYASHLRIVLRKEKVVSSPVRGHTSPTLRSVSECYWRREVVNFPESPFTTVWNRLIPIIFCTHKSFPGIFS